MTTALPNVPVGVPATMIAGDTLVFDILEGSIRDARGPFSSTTWALALSFTASTSRLDVDAVAQSGGWRVTITSAESIGLVSPDNTGSETVGWAGRVTSGSETFTVMGGRLTLYPDHGTAAGSLSAEEQELALLQAAVLAFSTSNITEYAVQGRMVRKTDSKDIHNRIGVLRYLIDQQKYPGQCGRGIEFHMRAPR